MTTTSSPPAGFSSLSAVAGRSYFPVSALARLPLSMLIIGALTYIALGSSDFATSGVIAAVAGIGVAVGAPLSGAASDRWGQRITLLVGTVAYVAALIALLLIGAPSSEGVPLSFPLVGAAFFAGVTVPQVGPMTRVRWLGLVPEADVRTAQTAQGYESTVDELSFVFGPALVGILAAAVHPAAPLIVAGVLAVTTIPAFAFHRTGSAGEPQPERDQDASIESGAGKTWVVVTALGVLGMMAIGTVFGSLAAVTTAFAAETGNPGVGGLIYAGLGVASGATALTVARWPQRWSASLRWLVCALLVMVAVWGLFLPQTPWQMALALFAVGAPIGPILVTIFTVTGDVAPRARLGVALMLVSAGVTLGTSIGNSVGGLLIDASNHSSAVWVTVVASAVLLVVGVFFAAVRQRHATADGQRVSRPVSVLEESSC